MGDDELEERLESMSTRPTPPVDPGFGNRLESELRRQFAEPATRRGSIMDVLLRPGVVVGMAAAVIAVVLIVAQRDTPVDLVMDSAEGTSISIPGQSETIDGVAGLSLPEGSRIVVAPEGSAVVADVVLDGGTTAEIVDGQLELVDVAPETTRPGTTVPGTTDPRLAVPESTVPDTTTPETTAAHDHGARLDRAPLDRSSDHGAEDDRSRNLRCPRPCRRRRFPSTLVQRRRKHPVRTC